LAFDDLKSHAALRKQTSIAVALGERWYNRWQFREILESQAASIIQPDPFFAMGLTEVRKITDLASAFGVPVIPHCNESFRYSAHLAFALPERIVPMMEFGIKTNHNFQHFFQDFFEPIKGFVHLPDGPGWGTQIDWDKVNEKIDLLY
jgi:L-alanine-DL-glutamate epimerase-like enolase superfamily enzyme